MAITPPVALGAAGQVLNTRALRLALGASFRPGAGVTTVSGVLHGPANTMGELTLLTATSYSVQPFRAVIQGTHTTTQGQYEVANDAVLTVNDAPAQDASQFRRSLIVVGVDDSQAAGVASSPTTDRGRIYTIPGALAVSNPALPALPANHLALGELSTPPAGQQVTITPYNPRTTVRGGILPVLDTATNRSGHAGAPPLFTGEYRDHPTRGLQRGVGSSWRPATPAPAFARVLMADIPNLPNMADVQVTGGLLTAAEYDPYGMWNGSPSAKRFEIPWSGLWRLRASLWITGLVAADTFILRITSNAVASPPGTVIASDGHRQGYVTPQFEGYLGAGTWAGLQFYTTKAGTAWQALSYGARSYFWAEYLGPAA